MRLCDGHCDTILKISSGATDFDFSFIDTRLFDGFLQIFACFCENEEDNVYTAEEKIKKFLLYIKNFPYVQIAYTPCHAQKILSNGGLCVLLALENCSCLGDDPENLMRFYNLGVRSITLTWNDENHFASGSLCSSGGLKARGKELILLAEKLGVLIDVSHLNRQSFYDVLSFGHGKLFASHSSCHAITPNPRNLTDSQILDLFKAGGIVCACPNPPFISSHGVAAREEFVHHLRHLLTLTGGIGVALGSDMDGTEHFCQGLKTTLDYYSLSDFLKANDFTDFEIQNIFSCNFERFLSKIPKK